MRSMLLGLALALPLIGAFGQARAADATLDRITTSGEIRIGVELTAPWSMKDGKGNLTGFEVDMTSRLAADIGVKPVYVELAFDDLIPKLEAGEIDLIAAGMTITAQRALKVAFSDPVNISSVTVVWRRLAEDAEPDPAAKQKIAVLAGSSDEHVAELSFPDAERKSYPSTAEALAALLSGEVDGMVASAPSPELAAHLYDSELVLGDENPLATQADAFAMRPDDARLTRLVDNWISAREADGYLTALRDYYFGGFDWLEAMPAEAGQ